MAKKIIIILLLLLGLFARLYRFSLVPESLYWDEAAIGLDARSLLEKGEDLNGKSWFQPLFYSYGDYKAPIYIWLTTLTGKAMGRVDELAVRLPSLLAFFGTAVTFYLLLKRLYPKSTLPVLATVSLAVMPWSIHFSRIGFESHLSLFFLVLTVYLAVMAVTTKRYWWLIGAAIAIVFGTLTYINLRIIGPLLLAGILTLWPAGKLKQRLPHIVGMIAIIGLGFWWLTHSSNYAASQFYRLSNDNLLRSVNHIKQSVSSMADDNSLVSRLIHHRYLYWGETYLANYFKHFEPKFLFVSGDPNLRHHSGWGGELLLLQLPLLLFGLIKYRDLGNKAKWLVFGWLLLAPAVAALVNEVPHASRSIYLMIPLAWLIGLGWSKLNSKWQFIVGVLLLINLSLFTHDYFRHYPSRSALSWIKPYKEAALTFKDQPTVGPVYVSPKFYKPELYFAFYLNDLSFYYQNNRFNYYLPDVCPEGASCVDWQ